MTTVIRFKTLPECIEYSRTFGRLIWVKISLIWTRNLEAWEVLPPIILEFFWKALGTLALTTQSILRGQMVRCAPHPIVFIFGRCKSSMKTQIQLSTPSAAVDTGAKIISMSLLRGKAFYSSAKLPAARIRNHHLRIITGAQTGL